MKMIYETISIMNYSEFNPKIIWSILIIINITYDIHPQTANVLFIFIIKVKPIQKNQLSSASYWVGVNG